MIGNRPKQAPSSAEFSACPTGIEYTTIATRIARTSAMSEAMWALSLSPPSRTNSVTIGTRANSELRNSESPTGSRTCSYTAPPRCEYLPADYPSPQGVNRLRVALFITCFNDTLFPRTGQAVVELLERLGHEVEFPEEQTCCGQMHFNKIGRAHV